MLAACCPRTRALRAVDLIHTEGPPQLLEKWMHDRVEDWRRQRSASGAATPGDATEGVQQIYYSVLSELIRQVGIHCEERGALLAKLWRYARGWQAAAPAVTSHVCWPRGIEKSNHDRVSELSSSFGKLRREHNMHLAETQEREASLKQRLAAVQQAMADVEQRAAGHQVSVLC